MAVMRARVFTPARVPSSTIVCASSLAFNGSLIKAPLPVFTSRMSAEVPSAIFLLIMLDAINGIAGTVPVTSRSA